MFTVDVKQQCNWTNRGKALEMETMKSVLPATNRRKTKILLFWCWRKHCIKSSGLAVCEIALTGKTYPSVEFLYFVSFLNKSFVCSHRILMSHLDC